MINWMDILIMLIILINVIMGISRGMIRGIINFIGIISAIFLSIFWFREIGKYISQYFTIRQEIANLLGFMLIFLGVCLIARIIELLLKGIFSLLFISWIDRLGGALFGFIKGSLWVGILLIVITLFPVPEFLSRQLEESFLANRFALMITATYSYFEDWLPAGFQWNIDEFLRKFNFNLFV